VQISATEITLVFSRTARIVYKYKAVPGHKGVGSIEMTADAAVPVAQNGVFRLKNGQLTICIGLGDDPAATFDVADRQTRFLLVLSKAK
jgi:hypothetical protein